MPAGGGIDWFCSLAPDAPGLKAERQLVMVSGRIFAETTAAILASDPDAQRRFLGVEPLADTGAEPAPAPEG